MKKISKLFLTLALGLFAVGCEQSPQENAASRNAAVENKIETVGSNWQIKFPVLAKDGAAGKNVEYRLLKDTNHTTFAADVDAEAATVELSDAANYPPAGKIYTFNGETIGYSSISGNVLQGLVRGTDGGTAAQSHTKGQAVHLITAQNQIGDKTEIQIPQLPDSYWVHYRRQDDSKAEGGWSGWAIAGYAWGTGNAKQQ